MFLFYVEKALKHCYLSHLDLIHLVYVQVWLIFTLRVPV
jgi:hypothetical protein